MSLIPCQRNDNTLVHVHQVMAAALCCTLNGDKIMKKIKLTDTLSWKTASDANLFDYCVATTDKRISRLIGWCYRTHAN